MKKKYLAFLSISIILLLFLIPLIISDIGDLNKINKGFELNTQSNNNLKHIHETNYNLTLEQRNTLKYTNRILNDSTLNIGNSNFNLKQVNNLGNDNEKTFSYEQEYKGVPVFGSSLNIVKKNNTIIAIKKNYYDNININTKKNISDKQLNEIIGENLNITLRSHFNNITFKDINFNKIKETTVILPIEEGGNIKYKLAKEIDLPLSKSPLSSWTYFIDMDNGNLIKKINKIVSDNVNGYVFSKVYPEDPNQTAQDEPFSKGYVNLQTGVNRSLYSGSGDNLDNIIITKNNIDLKSVSSATLSFSTKYEIESNYDFVYIWISSDGGITWDFPPLSSYTGSQSEWTNESISISAYAGKDILLAFEYVTDEHLSLDGFYLDNIKVDTNDGIKFQDDFENGSDKWNITGFSIVRSYLSNNNTYTNESGFYSLNGEEKNSTLYSYFSGPFASVVNMVGNNDIFYDKNIIMPAVSNWNWFDYDSSYKNEESNLFYHINKVHDFFTKGSPFDITEMNYATKAIYNFAYSDQLATYCNAFSDGTDIYFFPKLSGYCDSPSLYSDIIYHEYTHNVVAKVYGTTDLPYENQSGAMNEGWADYFAATINNNSCMSEGFEGMSCLRNLNNSNKYPDNFTNEVHTDSSIFSGALWDLRSKAGADLADNLTIETMKLKAQDFSEYLDDMLFVDNNEIIPLNGTPNWHSICSSFSKHGIVSDFCSPKVLNYSQTIEIEEGETKNAPIFWENPIQSTDTTLYYCSPSFSNCSYYHYENSKEMQSGIDGNYTDNISINKNGTWKFFVYTLSDNINYTSDTYNISVYFNTFCGDSICNGTESCSSCPSDCGNCQIIPKGGGGSGGTKLLQEWTLTQTINETQIKNGYTQELGKNQRFKFTISNQNHYVGIKNINETGIILELNSTPQNFTFNAGETKKFNLSSEGYYDLQITLNNLENNKANLTIIEIYEAINKSSAINNGKNIENSTKENESDLNASFQSILKTPSNKEIWVYTLITLVIIALIVIYFSLYKIHHFKIKHNKGYLY
jgi:Zn-dependent metalloprotease